MRTTRHLVVREGDEGRRVPVIMPVRGAVSDIQSAPPASAGKGFFADLGPQREVALGLGAVGAAALVTGTVFGLIAKLHVRPRCRLLQSGTTRVDPGRGQGLANCQRRGSGGDRGVRRRRRLGGCRRRALLYCEGRRSGRQRRTSSDFTWPRRDGDGNVVTSRVRPWWTVAPLVGLVACADLWGFDELRTGSSDASLGSESSGSCPAPTVTCAGACVDITSDRSNCGGCNNSCGASQVCQESTCVNLVCPTNATPCPGACVFTQADNNNCGQCGVQCPAGATCQGGACVCQAGQTRLQRTMR